MNFLKMYGNLSMNIAYTNSYRNSNKLTPNILTSFFFFKVCSLKIVNKTKENSDILFRGMGGMKNRENFADVLNGWILIKTLVHLFISISKVNIRQKLICSIIIALPGKSVYCLRLCQCCCRHLDVLAQWKTFGFFLSISSKSFNVGAGWVLLFIADKRSVSALLNRVLRWTCNTISGWRFRMACRANLEIVAL